MLFWNWDVLTLEKLSEKEDLTFSTTVFNDLEKLDMKHLTMDNIMKQKKSTFINMVKHKNEEETFEDLEKKKSSHSKVEKEEHTILRIQRYLQPSRFK